MNKIPHTIFAPASHRPNPGQVMREAINRKDARKWEWRDSILTAASHAAIFIMIVLSVVAMSLTANMGG